jgi:hypothetical protein
MLRIHYTIMCLTTAELSIASTLGAINKFFDRTGVTSVKTNTR